MIASKKDFEYYVQCDMASLANKPVENIKRYIRKNPIAKYQYLLRCVEYHTNCVGADCPKTSGLST